MTDLIVLRNARIVYRVAALMNVSPKLRLAAFEAALVESDFRNLASTAVPESLQFSHDGVSVDFDSVGVFQQRADWGSVEDRMDVFTAARRFLIAAALKNRPELSAGDLAQEVQVSAFGSRYAERYQEAQDLLTSIGRQTVMIKLVKLAGTTEVYLSVNLMHLRKISNTSQLKAVQAELKNDGYDATVRTVDDLGTFGVVS